MRRFSGTRFLRVFSEIVPKSRFAAIRPVDVMVGPARKAHQRQMCLQNRAIILCMPLIFVHAPIICDTSWGGEKVAPFGGELPRGSNLVRSVVM